LSQIAPIIRYKEYLENELPWKDHLRVEALENTQNFLNIFNLIATTNLSIKKSFLLAPEIFDIVVVDEATQSNIASILPVLYRAKSIVIIGDPLQLPHITKIDDIEEKYVRDKLELQSGKFNYIKNSLFHLAKDISDVSALKSFFLNEHFRCHPDIINFSNIYFYQMKAGHELSIKTKKENFNFGNPGIHWIDVKGIVDEYENKNIEEARKSLELAERLSIEFPSASIGIISPFRNQVDHINIIIGKLKEKDVTCGTVHNFQGDEKDIIIFSLIVNQNSKSSLTRFINEYQPYLLNVAITRARSALYIVGDFEYCKSLYRNGSTLLSNLANYVESKENPSVKDDSEVKRKTNVPKVIETNTYDEITDFDINSVIKFAIDNNKNLKIEYSNSDKISSERVISNIQISNEFEDNGFLNQHIKAYCHKRNEDRTFKISRIIRAEIVH
jgi:superfamily I DNA and/or RNA helicase